MQKKLILITFFFLSIGCLTGNSKGIESEGKQVITVSIVPQKYFIDQLAGDYFEVNIMVPPGASPDDYEPSPKQLKSLSKSKAYFYLGHLGFEKSWMKRFTGTAPNVKFIPCNLGLDLLEGDCHHEHVGTASHTHGTDPHIWTSPENVKTITKTICNELSKLYPSKKKEFEKNYAAFVKRINEMDTKIRIDLENFENRSFMIYHPALAYFARDYFLHQYSIEYEGKSPSTAHMKEMVDLARREKIKTVFIQSQFESEKAQAIAKEIGAKVVSIDPLAYDWMAETERIAKELKETLSNSDK